MKPPIDQTLYDLLNVLPSATTVEIKASYRAAVKQHHPDRGGNPETFLSVTRAYNVLSDEERRSRYDDTGQIDLEAADESQRDLVSTLSSALDLVLSRTSLDIATADFVAEMHRLVRTGMEILSEELATIERRLKSLRSARQRLKRKDENADLFLRVIEGQIKALSDAQSTKRKAYRAQERAIEELGRYDSFVEIARSVQSGLPGGEAKAT
jgi:curved DNA-binding protein CbpA